MELKFISTVVCERNKGTLNNTIVISLKKKKPSFCVHTQLQITEGLRANIRFHLHLPLINIISEHSLLLLFELQAL